MWRSASIAAGEHCMGRKLCSLQSSFDMLIAVVRVGQWQGLHRCPAQSKSSAADSPSKMLPLPPKPSSLYGMLNPDLGGHHDMLFDLLAVGTTPRQAYLPHASPCDM